MVSDAINNVLVHHVTQQIPQSIYTSLHKTVNQTAARKSLNNSCQVNYSNTEYTQHITQQGARESSEVLLINQKLEVEYLQITKLCQYL